VTAIAEALLAATDGVLTGTQIDEIIFAAESKFDRAAEQQRRSDWRAKTEAAEAAGQFERLPIG
jgi:hypothetical protein